MANLNDPMNLNPFQQAVADRTGAGATLRGSSNQIKKVGNLATQQGQIQRSQTSGFLDQRRDVLADQRRNQVEDIENARRLAQEDIKFFGEDIEKAQAKINEEIRLTRDQLRDSLRSLIDDDAAQDLANSALTALNQSAEAIGSGLINRQQKARTSKLADIFNNSLPKSREQVQQVQQQLGLTQFQGQPGQIPPFIEFLPDQSSVPPTNISPQDLPGVQQRFQQQQRVFDLPRFNNLNQSSVFPNGFQLPETIGGGF